MKIVYVAGPFRSDTSWDIEQNVRKAEETGLEVAMLGAMPLIPHSNTRFFHGLINEQFWIDGTLSLLNVCDALILVQGNDWSKSIGTLGEIDHARNIGIPVFYELYQLEAWLKHCDCEEVIE